MEFQARRPLVPATLAMAAGVAAGILPPPGWWPLGVAAFCGMCVAWVRLRGRAGAGWIFLPAVAAGGFSLQLVARQDCDPHAVHRRGLAGVEGVALRGRVATIPELRDAGGDGLRLDFVVDLDGARRACGVWERCTGRVRLMVRGMAPEAVGYGRRVEWTGVLREPRRALNPGEFDARGYWRRKGVRFECRLSGADLRVAPGPGAGWMERLAGRFRDRMRVTLARGIQDDPRIAAVIAGMLYGDRSGFDEGLIESFRRTGTMHLFAVSGQNVGVLAAAGILVLRLAGMSRWRHGWALIPALGLYTLATGAQPSAVRAFVMASLVLAAWLLDRPVDAVQLLSAAAFGILAAAPGQVLDAGFQLSFSVVFALVALTPPLYRRLKALGAPDTFLPRRLWPAWRAGWEGARRAAMGTVAAAVAAFAGSVLLCAWHFHLVSPASIGVNVVVVPLASLVVLIGALSLAGGMVHPLLSELCNNANWLAASAIVGVVTETARIPYTSFYVGPRAGGEVEVVALSVGAGQAAIVRSGGRCELFDCGGPWEGRGIVAPALRYHGINRIDRLWLGHGDADHIGGAEGILRAWPVSRLMLPASPARSRTLLGVLEKNGTRATALGTGDALTAGKARWRILHPGREPSGPLADDRGLVAKLEWAGGAVLFMEDPGASVERVLLESGADLRADVVIAGSHAREEGLGRELIEAVRPAHVVFNGGRYERDRLAETQRRRLEAARAQVWDLSRTGAVMIRGGREGVRVVRWKVED